MMTLLTRIRSGLRAIRANVGHVTPYHRGNSRRGVRRYAREGKEFADFDVLLTREGTAVNTHWKRPLAHGFRDPQGRIPRSRPVGEMTLAEVLRLRTRDGYRINTVQAMRRVCKRLDVTPLWELKPSWRWKFVRVYERNFRPGESVMVIGVPPRWDWLEPAKKAGLTTVLLWRGRCPADVWPHVDVVKAVRRPRGLPERVVWLGPGGRR